MNMNFGYALLRRNRFSIEGKKRLVQTELAIFKETLKLSQPELPYQVESILAFIQEHLFENWLNFKEIKRRTGIRNNNISSHFKFYIGLGTREYIECQRIEAAKALLQDGDFNVFLISISIGYADSSSFCRAFRRRVGCSPGVYREEMSRTDGKNNYEEVLPRR